MIAWEEYLQVICKIRVYLGYIKSFHSLLSLSKKLIRKGKKLEQHFCEEDTKITSKHMGMSLYTYQDIQIMVTASAGKDSENLNHPTGLVVIENTMVTLKTFGSVVSFKMCPAITIEPSNCMLGYLLQRNKNIFPHENLLMGIYRCFVYNSLNWNLSRCLSTGEWHGVCVSWNTPQQQMKWKIESPRICDEFKEANSKGSHMCNCTYIRFFKL